MRCNCQNQDDRHGEDDTSVHTAQQAVCSGPKQHPDDDSREQCEEDACADHRCANRQQMRSAHRRKTDRTSPTGQDRLRHPKDEQAQKDDAGSDYR